MERHMETLPALTGNRTSDAAMVWFCLRQLSRGILRKHTDLLRDRLRRSGLRGVQLCQRRRDAAVTVRSIAHCGQPRCHLRRITQLCESVFSC